MENTERSGQSNAKSLWKEGGRYSFITATDYFCALWLGAYRKLWSILKNVEMNHNKRALTRNRCQWSVNISWPGKGRYIYTCTTLIGNNFYCVLKSSTLNQNKARFKVWIKQKLALYRTNLIWMTFLHQCKHLFSMLSCIGNTLLEVVQDILNSTDKLIIKPSKTLSDDQ